MTACIGELKAITKYFYHRLSFFALNFSSVALFRVTRPTTEPLHGNIKEYNNTDTIGFHIWERVGLKRFRQNHPHSEVCWGYAYMVYIRCGST